LVSNAVAQPVSNCAEEKGAAMDSTQNIHTVLEAFIAIEQRDIQRLAALVTSDFESHWPPSLPYGGTKRGLNPEGTSWSTVWEPLQPTMNERKMDAQIIAACADQVVVLWHQRGVSPAGEHFDGEVLGLYQLSDGRLRRAQMFYFDTMAVASFLDRANRRVKAVSK
jgi:ketosteroid isomerase-like protein